MPVFIESVKYKQENIQTSPETWTDYLKGNIFEKITLEVIFRSEHWAYFDSNNPILFKDSSFKTDDWITDLTLHRWNGFAVGDEIVTTDTSSNNATYLISEIDGQSIRVTDNLGAAVTLLPETASGPGRINLVQDPTGIIFDYGLIENSEATNYDSKVDGSLMRHAYGQLAAPLPSGPTPVLPEGKKDWQLGECSFTNTTTGTQRDAYSYHFTFSQDFYIHPFYLDNQISDLTNTFPIAPRYWRDTKALKHVFRIRAMRELQDPNVFQEGVHDAKDGQTGWFDEQYNGGTERFSLSNFAYSNTIDAIDIDKTTGISFNIDSNVAYSLGGTSAATDIVLNFIVLPETANDYTNRDEYMQVNYCFDRAAQVAGAPFINGEQYGTGYQVFSNVVVTSGVSTVVVTADIILGSDVKAKLATLTNARYLIAAYATISGRAADLCDYTTVLVDVKKATVDIQDASLNITNTFLYHDQNALTPVVTTPIFRIEDEIVAQSLVLIDHAQYPNAQIDYLKPQIIAKKSGEDDVILLQEKFDLSGQPLSGAVRVINENPVTSFNVNSAEIRYNFRCYRSTTDDIANEYAYRVQFPFLWRWEYWEKILLGVVPSGWYDTAEPSNGLNNDWLRLAGLTGWDIYYNLEAQVDYSGSQKVITSSTIINPQDYLAGSNWTTENITAFDGASALTYSGSPYIMQNKQTTIKANFTDASGLLTASDVYMVARLIPKEGGTYIANETLSSVYDRTFAGGIFIGDSSGLIDITLSGAIFTGTFDIDYTKIPTGLLDYTLSVSIGVDSTAGLTDYGDVQLQNMKVLEVLEEPKVIPKEDNPFTKCCYDLNVLADLTDTDEFKNDFSAPIQIIPLQYSVNMILEKLEDGLWTPKVTLTNNNYGTYYVLGFESKNNKNYVGYKIDWAIVLDSSGIGWGTGRYRINFDTGSLSIYSSEYCLSAFSTSNADRTVRVNYKWDRLIGSETQQKTRDFVGLDWDNQIRLSDAIFGYLNADFETEDVKFENGMLSMVSKTANSKYSLELRQMPKEIQNIILFDVLMGDDISITDYNSENAGDYLEIFVEIDSSFSPNYGDARPNTDVELGFKSKFDNNNSLYS